MTRHGSHRRRTYGFSFSWRRALGISAAKWRLSRMIGIPLTESGRQRMLGRMVERGGCLLWMIVIVVAFVGLRSCFAPTGPSAPERETRLPAEATPEPSSGQRNVGFPATPVPTSPPVAPPSSRRTPKPSVAATPTARAAKAPPLPGAADDLPPLKGSRPTPRGGDRRHDLNQAKPLPGCYNILLKDGDVLRQVTLFERASDVFILYRPRGAKDVWRIDRSLVKSVEKADCAGGG
jgi:hypothetical protein